MKNVVYTGLIGLFLSFSPPSLAQEGIITDMKSTALPVPRFVTLNAEDVNVRTGPGMRYPIRWVFKKEGLPVEVIREFDIWRQIRTMNGDEGWVNKTMLSGKRAVIITGQTQTVFKKSQDGSRPVVKLEPGVIAQLETCQDMRCLVHVAGYEGWIDRAALWGVYKEETFKE